MRASQKRVIVQYFLDSRYLLLVLRLALSWKFMVPAIPETRTKRHCQSMTKGPKANHIPSIIVHIVVCNTVLHHI
jgi:hypothetical protein